MPNKNPGICRYIGFGGASENVSVADNFSQFEYDGINKYESGEDFPARKEGEEYFGWVIRGGCDVYFNTEKKFSGIEFNVNYYYENTMKYYYAYLNLDYTPVTVTLPTVE